MSEEIMPDITLMSDVPEAVESQSEIVNLSDKSLAELVKLFEELAADEERMKRFKEAEAIKAAFYKRLIKEKSDAGYVSAESEAQSDNPFVELENGFKEIYNIYKKERAEYNKALEQERENNLAMKEAVIADLKAL